MFAPNVVGTANATAAGWGNLGGGVTQMTMPLLFTAFLSAGAGQWWSWRLAMAVPGVALFLMGIFYYFFTQDTPAGDWTGKPEADRKAAGAGFFTACKDRRVWALALIYAACFGMELTVNNVAALYFVDYFGLGLQMAGVVAGAYGMMNIFARPLGGYLSDRCHLRLGLRGRVKLLGILIACEGLAFLLFSRAHWLPAAIGTMMLTGLFVQMSNGATYSVVPFINRRALGAVAGLVGAGGNVGAVAAGFLFKTESITWPTAFAILGGIITVSAALALLVRFTDTDELAARPAASHAAVAMAGATAAAPAN